MGREFNGGRTRPGASSGARSRAIAPDLDQLAHDLRTPLSAVLMWTRLLRAGAAPDPEAALQAIEKSAVEISRALDLLSPASPPREASGDAAPAKPGSRARAPRRRP